MKKTLITATLYTLITAVLLGIGYPLLITGIDRVLFPKQADGELLTHNGDVIGSHLIGQTFIGDTYSTAAPRPPAPATTPAPPPAPTTAPPARPSSTASRPASPPTSQAPRPSP